MTDCGQSVKYISRRHDLQDSAPCLMSTRVSLYFGAKREELEAENSSSAEVLNAQSYTLISLYLYRNSLKTQ
jgi:hypothetical protein